MRFPRRRDPREFKGAIMRITAELLRQHNACEDQVEIFEERWPSGVTPNKRSLAVAQQLGLDIRWCDNLLTVPGPVWTEYLNVIDPAWAECKKVRDAARTECKAEYLGVMVLAFAEYKKVRDAALLAALRAS